MLSLDRVAMGPATNHELMYSLKFFGLTIKIGSYCHFGANRVLYMHCLTQRHSRRCPAPDDPIILVLHRTPWQINSQVLKQKKYSYTRPNLKVIPARGLPRLLTSTPNCRIRIDCRTRPPQVCDISNSLQRLPGESMSSDL